MKNIILLLMFLVSQSIFSQSKFETKKRIENPEKKWSQTVGDISVCLWNDDKLSAFSITIDDNNEQDIPFWKETQIIYNFPYTWFLITESPNKKNNVKNWSLFNQLAKQGNAIQGHDDQNWYNKPKDGQQNMSLKAYKKRLKKTKKTIEKHIDNQKCITYAYPWGQGNQTVASQLFIANRSAIGLLNKANAIDFKNVKSISSKHIVTNDSTRNHYFNPLLTKTAKLEEVNYYRGWGVTHFHDVKSDAAKKTTTNFLHYIKHKEEQLWLGTFPDVAKYAQEYKAHKITIKKNTDQEINFCLTDDLEDKTFNYPLTVKIRLANNWTTQSATQNEKKIPLKTITFNENQYALVKVIPDAGQVTIKGSLDTGKSKNSPTSRYEEATVRDAFHVPSTISPEAQEMMKAYKRSVRNQATTPKGNAPHKDWKKFQTFIDSLVISGLQPIKDFYQAKIDTVKIGGIRAIEITSKNYKKNDKIIFYIHGGAYVVLSADATLASMLPLAESSGIKIVAIDYTLSPQKKFQAVTNEVLQFYKGLLQEYDAKNIAIYGDSAGGGLSAGSILKMRDQGIELPSCLVLWSPWSDIDQIGDTYFTLADNDPLLINNNFLENAALAYAPKSEFKNPYVSPVYGDYSKPFPPTLIQVGGKEIFLSNAIRHYRNMDDAGKTVKLDVYEGMWHVWQGHYLLPESKKAVENTKKFMFKYLQITN